jgi:hypothetical protein
MNKMKENCEKLHEGAFNGHPGAYSEIMLQEVDIELLKRYAGLETWSDSEKPSLLLLLGDNMEDNDNNRGLLWLSPAALQILHSFDSLTITSFYSPQQSRSYRTRKVPFDHLLSSIIYQLFSSSGVSIDAHSNQVYRRLEQDQNGSCDRLAILRMLLKSFRKGEKVVMVLDRIDLVERDDLEPWDIIDQLVEVVAEPEIVCIVKLAVLGLQDDFRGIKHIDHVVRKRRWAKMNGKEVSVHGKLDWRQEVIDDD